MSIEAVNSYELTKVAMCIKYALESLEEGKIEACVDSLNNAFWYIGTTVEELDNMNEDEVWG